MKHTRVVSTKCTPGFVCRAFSDTTRVCFIVNEHTTKCSRYSTKQMYHVTYCRLDILLEAAYDKYTKEVGEKADELLSFEKW